MNDEEQNIVATEEAESDNGPRFSHKIGNMTYLIGIHYKQEEGENFADKLNRMMRSELNVMGEFV